MYLQLARNLGVIIVRAQSVARWPHVDMGGHVGLGGGNHRARLGP